MQENILMANELLDSRLKSKELGVMYKINFAMAFEHVSWDSFINLLGGFGFG